MILAVDIGNTHVTLGAFEGGRLIGSWRLASDVRKTADEYGPLALDALERTRPGMVEGIRAVVIGSVVPALTSIWLEASDRYFKREALLVTPETELGVPLRVDHPEEVGVDRILNALAAKAIHGAPALVLDLGSATTFDCIASDGGYLGGAILVGPNLMAQTLAEKTAQLPNVAIAKPRRVIGKNTVECLQAGLFEGYLGMLERILAATLREMKEGGDADPKILLTGGLAGIFAPYLSVQGEQVGDLTLQGLRLASERILKSV